MASNIFFTSDVHFGHKNIIRYSNRPFNSVTDMNETLIRNWNSVVPENGVVYSLGDFAFSKIEEVESILHRLNGRIYMISGNHDEVITRNARRILDTNKVVKIVPYWEIKHNGQDICLFHYGCRVWNKSHRGSWLLFGHSHGSLPPYGKSVDVGVDSTYVTGKAPYMPLSFEQIDAFMAKRKIESEDYHGD